MAINEEIGQTTSENTHSQYDETFGVGIKVEANHPLYLAPCDVSGISLISFQLTGTANYSLWLCSMRIALLGHNKLVQGTSSVPVYYSRLKDLWNEAETLVPIPGCNCEKSRDFVAHVQRQKLYQFLMGLNESYTEARSQILLMVPLPSVNQAYSTLASDENQKSMVATSVLSAPPIAQSRNDDSTALYSARPSSGNGQRFKKTYDLYFEFCKIKGHTKETCYKIVGYPNYKFKKKGPGGQSYSTAYNVLADTQSLPQSQDTSFNSNEQRNVQTTAAQSSGTQGGSMQMQMPSLFTKEQYEQILNMLNTTSTPLANTAAPTKQRKVFLSTGDIAYVTHVGSSILSKGHQIDNVLYIPKFKFNLMSVAQDLFSGKVKVIGREKGGLYLLPSVAANAIKDESCSLTSKEVMKPVNMNKADLNLWHRRLGHPFSKILKNLFSASIDSCTDVIKNCFVCPCAKKVRLPFPSGSSRSSNSFELLHFDQNGAAERKHKHVLKVCRAIRFQGYIPLRYWGHCVLAATYLINRMPSTTLNNKSPYEMIHGSILSLDHIRVLGCLCFAKAVSESDKLKSRSITAVHMGYSNSQKGYILYDLANKLFFVNKDVDFRE
ncbi:uncharacterized protein LOC132031715 [Lycium ferocissimum]|uniref:uncharacterized protein LOC132031715 n=1 Tax=Lycium ferocissimum TaxID=112874 RepID=UPI0028164BED|nr:uncharacterized protein LOC132031715 [Lycium ferocissimum]